MVTFRHAAMKPNTGGYFANARLKTAC